MKKLMTLLIMLVITATLNAGTTYPSLYAQVQNDARAKGLDPVLEKIYNDPNYTFKGNRDYEIFIDMLIAAADATPQGKPLQWWENPAGMACLGFIGGTLLTLSTK